MRCMAYCPQQAVEVSHLLILGVYLLAAAIPTAAGLAWLGARLPALSVLSLLPGWLIESAEASVVLALVYPLLHALLGIRWVNRLFTTATVTRFYRRYHEPDTRLEDLG